MHANFFGHVCIQLLWAGMINLMLQGLVWASLLMPNTQVPGSTVEALQHTFLDCVDEDSVYMHHVIPSLLLLHHNIFNQGVCGCCTRPG